MHGAGLAVHKASRPWLDRVPDNRLTRALWWLTTMVFVSLLWVFFRAASWQDSLEIIRSVGRDFSLAYFPAFASARMLWLVLMFVIIAAHAVPATFWERTRRLFVRSPWAVKLLLFILTVQLVLELRTADVSPFIYFQF